MLRFSLTLVYLRDCLSLDALIADLDVFVSTLTWITKYCVAGMQIASSLPLACAAEHSV